MLSVKPERPIDSTVQEVLRAFAKITANLNLDYFVVGATARDIVFTNVFGVDTGRANA